MNSWKSVLISIKKLDKSIFVWNTILKVSVETYRVVRT